MQIQLKMTAGKAVRHMLLLPIAGIYLLPFYIAIINTFKREEDILNAPLSLPLKNLTMDSLLRNFNSANFNVMQAYGSTLLIVGLTLFFVILTAAPLAYVISRNRRGFYKIAYYLLLAGMMIPIQVIMIPVIQILKTLGLMLTVPGLILVFTAWYMPFTTFVMSGYIGTISSQLDESAMMDGASPRIIFFRIILPLMRPIVMSVVIFVTLWTWNDFITPLIILGSGKFYTVTTGIYRAIGAYTQKWDDVFAILFYAVVPVALFFLRLQKHFIAGLTAGAMKG